MWDQGFFSEEKSEYRKKRNEMKFYEVQFSYQFLMS